MAIRKRKRTKATFGGIMTSDPDLEKLGKDLDAALSCFRISKLKIGKLLLAAKKISEYGEWLPWIKERGLTPATAANYMKLARIKMFRHLPDGVDPTYREAGMLADLTRTPKGGKSKYENNAARPIRRLYELLEVLGVPDSVEGAAEMGFTELIEDGREIKKLVELMKDLDNGLHIIGNRSVADREEDEGGK